MSKKDQALIEVNLTLERFGDKEVFLLAGKGEEVILPKKFLSSEAKAGDLFMLSLATEANYHLAKEKKAKELLNEILKGEG